MQKPRLSDEDFRALGPKDAVYVVQMHRRQFEDAYNMPWPNSFGDVAHFAIAVDGGWRLWADSYNLLLRFVYYEKFRLHRLH